MSRLDDVKRRLEAQGDAEKKRLDRVISDLLQSEKRVEETRETCPLRTIGAKKRRFDSVKKRKRRRE